MLSIQKLALSLALVALIALSTVSAHADDAVPPQLHQEREAFAKDFAQSVVAILYDRKESFDNRKDILRRAFSDSVDIEWIAKFVLGKSWNNATDEQKARYTALYRKYLTETYVANFAENPSNRISDIKVLNVADAEDDNFTVYTQMKLANHDTLKVNYLVHEKDKSYKVLDIAIENVSLIATHRTEFSTLANEQGVDGVIGKLEQLLNRGASVMTMSMN